MKQRGKKKRIVAPLLLLFLIAALFHTYFVSFGISLPQPGISGNTVFEDIKNSYEEKPLLTRAIIAAEWIAIIILIIYILIKGKLKLDHDMKAERKVPKETKIIMHKKSGSETDLDVLYKILQEKKVLRLGIITKTFSISKETAMDWCRILEEGNLAIIHYPTVGDPKIILFEEKKDEKAKEKKES